jgi:hypothetical protein
VREGEHFTTVVIPAYAAWETLPAVLDALEPQARRGDREVIVVESSGDGAETRLARWPWVRRRLVALLGLEDAVRPSR